MPEDEPASWLALAGVTFLFMQQAFNRWMLMKERRRNGPDVEGVQRDGLAETQDLRDSLRSKLNG